MEAMAKKEDFTMGASFGSSRDLEFIHVSTKNSFRFPQNNGDIFAFNSLVNSSFQHGIPKTKFRTGPRFSIIAWGRRRTLNARNSTKSEQEMNAKRFRKGSTKSSFTSKVNPISHQDTKEKAEVTVDVSEVSKMVEAFVLEKKSVEIKKTEQKNMRRQGRRRSRIQGGWSSQRTHGQGRSHELSNRRNRIADSRIPQQTGNFHHYNHNHK